MANGMKSRTFMPPTDLSPRTIARRLAPTQKVKELGRIDDARREVALSRVRVHARE